MGISYDAAPSRKVAALSISLIPDSPLAAKVFPSPNHGERRGGYALAHGIDKLILHYTGMADAGSALQKLCDPTSGVSAHYFVFEDGRILQLVPEGRRAWHAGIGAWAGDEDINSSSIGIEIAHPGHAGGLPAFPEAQIAAVTALCADILSRWPMPPAHVLAHSDVAPRRKEDPGEGFPWRQLAEAGIGHFTEASPLSDGRFFSRGDAGEPVEALQAMFAMYGYALSIDGLYGEETQGVVTAFQRHFRQERVDGVADASTIATLRDLIAAR